MEIPKSSHTKFITVMHLSVINCCPDSVCIVYTSLRGLWRNKACHGYVAGNSGCYTFVPIMDIIVEITNGDPS